MKFAVIGCGTVAQTMHIPNVVEHPHLDLFALLDPDADRRNELGDRYNVGHRHPDVESLLEATGDQLDGAIVCTPMHIHSRTTVPLMEADIPVLLEKPLAMTMEDADELVEAAARTDAVTMVAYMKRYSPAYQRAKSVLDELGSVDLVTTFDTDPNFSEMLSEVYDLVPANLPEAFVEESQADRRAKAQTAIDIDDPQLIDAYDFHLEHVCHDINALRGLFGKVERIDFADFFADGRYGTAILTYQNDIRCVLESGVGDRKWFEEYIRIDTRDGMIRLEFDNPLIRNDTPRLRIKQGLSELDETILTPSFRESFKLELDHFVDCLQDKAAVRTTFEEARDDLELIINLFRTHLGKPPVTRN